MDVDAEHMLSSPCSPSGWITEYLCIATDHRDMAAALAAYLAKGGKLDPEDGSDPRLVHTVFFNAKMPEDALTTLRAFGADLNIRDREGMNLLHRLANEGDDDALTRSRILVETFGFDVNERDDEGFPPVLIAVRNGHESIVSYLTAHGADPKLTSTDGVGILHMAAYGDLCFLVKRCLSEGDDVNVTTDKGYTPLHFAAMNGNGRVAELLLDHGADPNHANREGDRPVDMLRLYSVPEVQKPFTELLRRHGADVD
ncbi:MAG: hypothetical protein HON70_20725 [Lentisphaerae bacterium]|jgi:ankyrin repeat protein|nr:hypothetical protein [Lentisphaerota bacterium]